MEAGYASQHYAASFAEFGELVRLPRSGIHLLRRTAAPGLCDYSGLYPFVLARDWAALRDDFDDLRSEDAVAAVIVTDPFAQEQVAALEGRFDVLHKFKRHFIVDLTGDWRGQQRNNTRQYSRRGLEAATVTVCPASGADGEDFWRIYEHTIGRHDVTSIAAFSQNALVAQLATPGAFLVKAIQNDEITGLMLAYQNNMIISLHLIGVTALGRQNFANYALIQAALDWADKQGAHYVNLGGVAGNQNDETNGLALFKRGFTKDSRWTYLCGQVLNQPNYDRLSGSAVGTGFFPAYRAPATVPPKAEDGA